MECSSSGKLPHGCGVGCVCGSLSTAEAQDFSPGIRAWYHAETKRLSREVNPERIISPTQNSQDPRYSPELHLVFEVEGFWIPASKMKIYDDGSSSALTSRFRRRKFMRDEVLFLVHPESYDLYQDLVLSKYPFEKFNALSTASSRSLLVWKEGDEAHPFIAKLSLNKEIGGVVRSIKGTEIARSIGISKTLQESKGIPDAAIFMPEAFRAIPKGMVSGGQILRELGPIGQASAFEYLPLFAIYGADQNHSPLLLDWMKATGADPKTFVREELIRPFVKVWLNLAVEHGVLMEPHAQNVLIETQNGLPTGRFVFRDYGGFNIDYKFRERLGYRTPKLPKFKSRGDYFESEHQEYIPMSLYSYFEGGFLYNIEKLLKSSLAIPDSHWTHVVLRDELSKEFSKLVGRPIRVSRDFENLADIVNDAREHVVSSAGPAKVASLAKKALTCGDIFR